MEALQLSVESLAKNFNSRMADFQQSLNVPSSSPNSIAALAADFASFKAFITDSLRNLQAQTFLLLQQQDIFETRSRRKMLLVHGVPESKTEDTPLVLTKIMTEQLKIAEFSQSNMSRCHRFGKQKGSKPRSILVKLNSLQLKEKIWFAKSSLKGSGFTLSEFLTKPRHEAFMAARQHFGVTKTWTRDGNVHIITEDGARHRISTLEEVNKLVGSATVAAPDKAAVSSKATTSTAATFNAAGRSRRLKK